MEESQNAEFVKKQGYIKKNCKSVKEHGVRTERKDLGIEETEAMVREEEDEATEVKEGKEPMIERVESGSPKVKKRRK